MQIRTIRQSTYMTHVSLSINPVLLWYNLVAFPINITTICCLHIESILYMFNYVSLWGSFISPLWFILFWHHVHSRYHKKKLFIGLNWICKIRSNIVLNQSCGKQKYSRDSSSIACLYEMCYVQVFSCVTCNGLFKWNEIHSIPENKVNGSNIGPTWVLSAPDGPQVGPMNLAITHDTSYAVRSLCDESVKHSRETQK